MSSILTFGIKDQTEDDIFGVVMKTENSNLSFDKLKEMVTRIRDYPDMRDKFDLPMTSEIVDYEIMTIHGMPIGVFVFCNVTRNQWAEDSIEALIKQNPEFEIMKLNDFALARVVDSSCSRMSVEDIVGPWKGIYINQN